MAGILDKALGIHAQALVARSHRMEVLAANIANADTPNYKARDLDFKAVLQAAQGDGIGLHVTNSRHIGGNTNGNALEQLEVVHRVAQQSALDGNTVDLQVEQAAFARNAVEYQASLTFLTRRIQGLISAIKGE